MSIGDIVEYTTKVLDNSNETYCKLVGELEQYIQKEIVEYIMHDDVRVIIGSQWVVIRIPADVVLDASDLLTIELYFDCKFVETIQLTDYRQYEFRWR